MSPQPIQDESLFPKVIRVLGHDYQVLFVNNLLGDHNEYGRVNTRLHVIEIDKDCVYQQQLETLIHEVLEIICDQMALDLKHDKLQTIASCFCAVLTDNAGKLYF